MKYLFVLLFPFLSIESHAQNWDIELLKNINLNRNKSLDPELRWVSNNTTAMGIGTPLTVLAIGLFKKDSTTIHKGIFIAETVLVAAVITTALKYSINRTRPFATYPFLEKASRAGSPSFPSGHTSDAFAMATSVSVSFPKWYVVAPAFLWAGVVGYSRLHLGVHYPSDVAAGAIIGSGSTFLSWKANQWLIKKYKRK